MSFEVLPTDRLFADSPDAEDPACLCSRCGLAFNGESPVRAWPEDGNCEYRFHPHCIGVTPTYYPDEDDDYDFDYDPVYGDGDEDDPFSHAPGCPEIECRVCLCCHCSPCEGGCFWAEEDLCSQCALENGGEG